MKMLLESLPEALSSNLTRLAANRWNLLLVLLVLDAFLHPYTNLEHDARLYAAQVLNRVESGFYDGDLYFSHGSQDRFSLFSLAMAPLTAGLGLQVSFFLVYLVSKALFLWGALRLFEALVEDRRASTLALLLVAIAPVPYAGTETFHVNETFLTPRLTASALVLLGLERMLAGRWLFAAGLLFVGLLLHPLIAFGGVLVYGSCLARRFLSVRIIALLAVPVAIGAVIVLLRRDLGVRLFGHMDEEWRFLVLRRSAHCFPAEWTYLDWARIIAAFVLVALASRYLRPDRGRFCWAVVLIGVLGVAGSWIAVKWPYALLLQGQPFRVLWLVQLLGFPLGFLLVFKLAAEERTFPQILTLFLLYGLCTNFDMLGRTALFLVCFFPLLVVCLRGLEAAPRNPQWLSLSAVGSAAVALSLALLLHVSSVIAVWQLLIDNIEPLLLVWGMPGAVEQPVLLLLAAGMAALALNWFGTGLRLRLLLVGLWLGYQFLLFGIDQSDAYCKPYKRDYANMVFVRESLQDELAAADRPLTIYWPTYLNHVWFHLHAHSYFNLMQTPGNIFHRETAVIGNDRARLVCKFELQYLRTLLISAHTWQMLARNYPPLPLHPTPDQEPPAPDREDLRRLCEDRTLDFVVTLIPIGDDYLATNGKVYIYDCRRVRE